MGSGCCSPAVSTLTLLPAREEMFPSERAHLPAQEYSRMAKIPAGPFSMGTNNALAYPADREGPKRTIELDAFWIDKCAVTNQNFAEFVESTGYTTEAEILGWSFVPKNLISELDNDFLIGQSVSTPWWVAVKGANWRQPLGPSSSYLDVQDHPAVHISWNDANAFASWVGKRLPTEAEWEKAARGGSENTLYPWGDELNVGSEYACNIWQGEFPEFDSGEDGFIGTAPVDSFKPNGYGLFNVCGNVWEWCYDWWDESGENKVIKGGSFLCHDSYCNRYRLSARTFQAPNSPTAHIGFRCVVDDK